MAILDQKQLIEFEVNEQLLNRPRYMMQMIPDGGIMDPHDDATTYRARRGFQAPVGYDDTSFEMDCDPFANLEDGYQTAKSACGNVSSVIGALTNDRHLAEACEGVCVVDFAQGYSTVGYRDQELKIATPLRCIKTLLNYEKKRVADYLSQEIDSFRETAIESYEYNLFKQVVEAGEANAVVKSVVAQPLPVLTKGGWDGTPTNRVTIDFLLRYRRQIMERLVNTKFASQAEDFVLEVEMTRDAWLAAKVADTLYRTGEGGFIPNLGNQVRIDESVFEQGSRMATKKFEIWEGKIRVIFNDHPIRGIMKPAGLSAGGDQLYEFVRIYHLKNEANEAGVSAVSNSDYYYNQAQCDGAMYDVIELIPHVHSESFKRYGLTKAIGPDGVVGHGNNFEVKLLNKADLSSRDCPNWFDEYYRYAARHNYRFRDIYPELSGFIAHKHEILQGYDMDSTGEVLFVKDGVATSSVEEVDNCTLETCAKSECLDSEVCVDEISLDACGPISTAYCGETGTLIVSATRECGLAAPDGEGVQAPQVATVEWCLIDDTAIYGTHYQAVDADGLPLAADGLFEWAEGETGTKSVCVNILDGLPPIAGEAPADTNCCLGTDATPVDALFDIQLKNVTFAALGCADSEVSIKNFAS